MASKDQGADKTEKPTPKRIRDARKEGNVGKSRELTATVLTLGWLVGGWLLIGSEGIIYNGADQAKALQIFPEARSQEFLASPPEKKAPMKTTAMPMAVSGLSCT